MNLSLVKKDLVKLGLSNNQTDIYLLLLSQGNSRISQISSSLEIPRSSVYEHLKGLFELGLAEEIIENNFKMIRAYSISSLHHLIDEQIDNLKTKNKNIESLEKSLNKITDSNNSTAIQIRYYKGRSGARQLLWNTLKAKSKIYVYSEWGRADYVGIKYYQNFVAESINRKINENVLINPLPRVLESFKKYSSSPISRTKIENIRTIEQNDIELKGETFIYDNIYAQVYLRNDEINGFEIEGYDFVNPQKSIFERLWSSADLLESTLSS